MWNIRKYRNYTLLYNSKIFYCNIPTECGILENIEIFWQMQKFYQSPQEKKFIQQLIFIAVGLLKFNFLIIKLIKLKYLI